MTATGSPSHEGNTGTAKLGTIVGNSSDPGSRDPYPSPPISSCCRLRLIVCKQDGTEQTKTEMVPTEGGGRIPARYQDFVDAFSQAKDETCPPHRPIDQAIDLVPGYKLRYGRIYNLSEAEPKRLKVYIETHLARGFIQRSSSRAAAPILFAKKKNGGLRLCVNYRALNLRPVKNRYPLPLISELLDRVRGGQIFTKLDLRNAYHLIWIKEGDEYRTVFRTRYGQFK
jgi:hypothetical protein